MDAVTENDDLASFMGLAGKRVLVTGASGFIGSHLCRRLLREGAEVHTLTSSVSSVFPPRLVDIRKHIVPHEGNLADRSAMDVLAQAVQPSHIFHLGAYTHVGKSWQRVDECVQTNVQGTLNLLQALSTNGYERFLYTGTSEIYGDIDVPFREDAVVRPISPYSVSKFSGELFCRLFAQSHAWPIVMVRPFNAYGPGQTPDRVIPEIITRALRGQDIPMTQGRQTREFNYVEDIAEGFLAAGTRVGVEGELFNIGCGEEVSIRDVTTKILDLMGNPVEAKFGTLPERPTEIWRMYCDSSRARTMLGWAPRHTLAEGLAKTIEWYQAEADQGDSLFA